MIYDFRMMETFKIQQTCIIWVVFYTVCNNFMIFGLKTDMSVQICTPLPV